MFRIWGKKLLYQKPNIELNNDGLGASSLLRGNMKSILSQGDLMHERL